ncbi:CCA tRNA nucleotidyltransferase [Eubacterium aggregans]|uniref:CCA tRNA nucleotidyltransferase n=1 Tax=Eubacterium aggregans TaxID=81409 RepID=UPI003F2A9DFB
MMKDALKQLFEVFHARGRQLYIVGGAVRDCLLGIPPVDIDFTTDALPEEMEAWFPHTINKGKRFGTIGVVLDGEVYEITTFRKDTAYQDGRHPVAVAFTDDVREDVIRRDFTINALIVDGQGVLYDYVGGLEDLEKGVLRCIGNPDERFQEDQLRKWRAIRLDAEKAMEIAAPTREAIHANPAIDCVSMERLREEFDRILLAEKVTWGGYLLVRTDLMTTLLRRTIPAFTKRQRDHHLIESFEIMAYVPRDLVMRLTILAVPMTPVERLEFFSCMRYPKAVMARVIALSRHFFVKSGDMVAFKGAIADIGVADFDRLLCLQQGQSQWDNNPKWIREAAENRAAFEVIKARGDALVRADLAVKGEDIKALGYDGSAIAGTLDAVLKWVYQHPEKNTKADLMVYLEEDKSGKAHITPDHRGFTEEI